MNDVNEENQNMNDVNELSDIKVCILCITQYILYLSILNLCIHRNLHWMKKQMKYNNQKISLFMITNM